jgi:hypothetical protein
VLYVAAKGTCPSAPWGVKQWQQTQELPLGPRGIRGTGAVSHCKAQCAVATCRECGDAALNLIMNLAGIVCALEHSLLLSCVARVRGVGGCSLIV